MNRTLLVAAILAVAGAAEAGTSVWTLVHSNTVHSENFSYRTQFVGSGLDWVIPNLTSTNKFDTYLLDATTAASYGETWGDWVAHFTGGGLFTFSGARDAVMASAFLPLVNVNPGWTLQSIDWHVNSTHHPVLRVTAEGVPEPTSAVLFLCGLCCCAAPRRARLPRG